MRLLLVLLCTPLGHGSDGVGKDQPANEGARRLWIASAGQLDHRGGVWGFSKSSLGITGNSTLVCGGSFAGDFFDVAAFTERRERIFYQPFRSSPVFDDWAHILPEGR